MVLLALKEGVRITGLDTRLLPGLKALAETFGRLLGASTVVITSVNDGLHKSGSLHYLGLAVDIRCNSYGPSNVRKVVEEFKRQYDADYDLIWESQGLPNEHLHLEYDPGNLNRPDRA